MRGLKSTIALIVVLGGLGAYIYFVTWKKTPDTTSTQEKVFVGFDADKVEELKVTSDKGDVTTLKKANGVWQIAAPVTAAADASEVSGIVSALGQLSVVRVVDENPSDLKDYGLASPRFEVDYKPAGGDRLPADPGRRQIADRQRSVREAQRRQAGVSDPGGPGKHVQQVDVRFARQGRPEVRARQGRRHRRHRRRQDAAARQRQRRLEDHAAAAGARRLRFGRGADRTAADDRHEIDRGRCRDAGRPEEVRARQAGRDRRAEDGQRPRHVRGRQQSRGRPTAPPPTPSTRATYRRRPSSPSTACSPTT